MATAKIFLWLACVGGSAAAVRYGVILLFSRQGGEDVSSYPMQRLDHDV